MFPLRRGRALIITFDMPIETVYPMKLRAIEWFSMYVAFASLLFRVGLICPVEQMYEEIWYENSIYEDVGNVVVSHKWWWPMRIFRNLLHFNHSTTISSKNTPVQIIRLTGFVCSQLTHTLVCGIEIEWVDGSPEVSLDIATAPPTTWSVWVSNNRWDCE